MKKKSILKTMIIIFNLQVLLLLPLLLLLFQTKKIFKNFYNGKKCEIYSYH